GPHASTSSPPEISANLTDTGPSGVRDARSVMPRANRIVGSPRPRCIGPSVCPRAIGRSVERWRLGTSGRLRLRTRTAGPRESRPFVERGDLQVVVERELVRVRPQPYRIEFVDPLVLDPGVDHVLGEDTALQQPLM